MRSYKEAGIGFFGGLLGTASAPQKSLEGKTHHYTAKMSLSLTAPYMLLAVTLSSDRHLLHENLWAFELL